MGTDIHFYIERRLSKGWECVPAPVRDLAKYPLTADEKKHRDDGHDWSDGWWGPGMITHKCYGPTGPGGEEVGCITADHGKPGCPACLGTGHNVDWYHNRNYRLFTILAGVRSYEKFPVIAPPRGEPADISPDTKAVSWWDHTPSWLLLSEVLAYDWDASAKCDGLLRLRKESLRTGLPGEISYSQWKESGGNNEPATYYMGSDREVISMEKADELIAKALESRTGATKRKLALHALPDVDVKCEWTMTAREACQDFIDFLEELVVPLLPPAYHETRAVLRDLEHGGAGFGDDRKEQHDRRVREFKKQLREIESEIRFVFGFDS